MSEIQLGNDSDMATQVHKFPLPFVVAIYIREFLSIIGIIVHEFSHYLMCVFLDVEILDWSIYPTSDENKIQFGSFTYAYTDNFRTNALINLAPLLFNTLIGVIMIIMTVDTLIPQTPLQTVYYFVILSILAKAIPSLGDVNNLEKYKSKNIGVSYILLVYPARMLAELSIYYVDYLIAVGMFYIVFITF